MSFCPLTSRTVSTSWMQLDSLQIQFLVRSPPCTAFSTIQKLFNAAAMETDRGKQKLTEGKVLLEHSMECARVQVQSNRFFVLAHPWRASSWEQDDATHVMKLNGARTVLFDQC